MSTRTAIVTDVATEVEPAVESSDSTLNSSLPRPREAASAVADLAAARFRAYRAGDTDALEAMVSALTPLLWHIVRAYGLDTATAEDVVQNTWLTLVRKADTVAEPQAVLRWLTVTARRDAWRAARVNGRVDLTDDTTTLDLRTTPAASPEQQVVRTADERALWFAVGKLNERCQRLLRIIAFHDRPDYSALSRELGMPVGSIGPTRGRCLDKLRAELRHLDERLEPGMSTDDARPGNGPGEGETTKGEKMEEELMTTADAVLLDQLQRMWEHTDPVPTGLVERVTFAIGLDNLDVELMRLTEEVLVPAGARGAEHVRTITFGGESVTVMVTVSMGDRQGGTELFRLDGWLAPSAALSIELRRADGSLSTVSDEDGRFVFEDVPPGLAQLVLHPTPNAAIELRQDVVAPAVQL